MQPFAELVGAARGWIAQNWHETGSRENALAILRQWFDWAYERSVGDLPGLDGAAALAARYAGRHADPDQAVAALIAWQSGVAGTAGFLTGIGGFVALPVAMPANIASAFYIQARLVAAIAHLRGYDIKSGEVRALALACLTGSKAADTLKDAGLRLGTRLARDGAGWLSPILFKKAVHAAHAPAVCVATRGTIKLGRFVPVVGGLVAGGFDAAMTQMIGRTADRVFGRPSTGQRPEASEARPTTARCPESAPGCRAAAAPPTAPPGW